ncbi:metal-dependent hydrolase [Allobacillus sp. SKP2-8]|uniref:metal-dependent hydrolase n=1 Tax=unclassified Allobacillus TaxID=2628859 RepID=UPI00118343F3|nr:metal-dependent hydrolase [Allobacillus sp. SKP2-8]TSJ66950.1 metal-dependent hydrolase [Allobacillus sp. SKP2-8]
MDTATHLTMGVALSGLSALDPVVEADPSLFTATFFGVVIGSIAPDFDTIFKLKDNATYIRHHRGSSHSPPMLIFWSFFVSLPILLFMPEVSYLHLWLWTMLAIVLHVTVDIFNAYGTQALRPFSRKWLAMGFINTFDPFIFYLFVAGIFAWVLGANPIYTFTIVFFIDILYHIKRYLDKKEIVDILKRHFHDKNIEKIITQPTIKHNWWRIAVVTDDQFFIADSVDGHIEILDIFDRKSLPETAEMNAALLDKNVQAFVNFSPVYRYEIDRHDDYIEIRFIDLRYRSKGHYPFVAVVSMDKFYNILTSYTGWVYSEEKLQKKLDVLP